MHITKIELENIKSHAEAKFEFQRGTTAIMGSNGAGKTTIIEAVAWTLFDLLDYKKDDFARRGAKSKGIARVSFASSFDEREYTVYRDTSTGYYVYDPQLKMRIAEKKEEVQSFLRQHLGVEPGTDLEALFRRAIGVPQGTFTAIFLESATERKKAFDRLLKVEEYRQGSEKLLETSRYIEMQKYAAAERIARAEGELSGLDSRELELEEVAAAIAVLSKTLEEITAEIDTKAKRVDEFDAVEKQLNELREKHNRLKFEIESAVREKLRIEAEFEKAKTAAERLKTVEKDHLLHLESISELAKLESQRALRDKIQAEIVSVENKIVTAKAEQKNSAEKAQKAHEAGQEIVKLEPRIAEQEGLEKSRESLRNQLAEAKSVQNQIESRQREIDVRRKDFKENKEKIEEAEKRVSLAGDLQKLVSRESEIALEIAKLRATIERDEQFQREIKNGLCPIMSQKCLNLKDGETLEMFVKSQFSDSKMQITTLETEQKTVSLELNSTREAERFVSALEGYRQREKDITEEGQRFKAEIESLKKLADNLPNLAKEAEEIEAKLRELNNPRERSAALQKEASLEADLHEWQAKIEKILEELDRERFAAAEKMEEFARLELMLAKFQAERDRSLAAHREFLANEALANSFSQRKTELDEAEKRIANLEKDAETFLGELNTVEQKYDRETHQNERAKLLSLKTREAESKARLEVSQKSEKNLVGEIERLKKVRLAMQTEFAEKERLEKVYEATKFIRDTLKEAAPRVARNYVFHVSNEANQMYREITGNAERTLKWTEDYGIVLEEEGYERPFLNLSGGEQMAAALSVRLALLKQLSEIRIAFFDEPTTNMDAERRENLATQIGNIKHFDQLFVISHDDTFEGYVDNVVTIGK